MTRRARSFGPGAAGAGPVGGRCRDRPGALRPVVGQPAPDGERGGARGGRGHAGLWVRAEGGDDHAGGWRRRRFPQPDLAGGCGWLGDRPPRPSPARTWPTRWRCCLPARPSSTTRPGAAIPPLPRPGAPSVRRRCRWQRRGPAPSISAGAPRRARWLTRSSRPSGQPGQRADPPSAHGCMPAPSRDVRLLGARRRRSPAGCWSGSRPYVLRQRGRASSAAQAMSGCRVGAAPPSRRAEGHRHRLFGPALLVGDEQAEIGGEEHDEGRDDRGAEWWCDGEEHRTCCHSEPQRPERHPPPHERLAAVATSVGGAAAVVTDWIEADERAERAERADPGTMASWLAHRWAATPGGPVAGLSGERSSAEGRGEGSGRRVRRRMRRPSQATGS